MAELPEMAHDMAPKATEGPPAAHIRHVFETYGALQGMGDTDGILALFADDASGAATAAALDRPHASLSDAWDDPAIADLLASHELLWHGPSEWAGLVAG